MKFSVLLPTRNRIEFLKYAVESVRRQDYEDWEIVVSDNCSEQDIRGFVDSLGEPRIKYVRTEKFIPVTDNWNNALRASTGDYVIMLGDDDCLLPKYFSTIKRLTGEYDKPDFIFTSGYLFAYPGVSEDYPDGYLRSHGSAKFFTAGEGPFMLDKGTARKCVDSSMNFRLTFDFNMQYSIVSRDFIRSLEYKGEFYQSPYPDYYAHNVMFLKARRILIFPKPMVVVGISPKSFGFYYINKLEKKGADFLRNYPDKKSAERMKTTILPGTDINTSWLFSMETIRDNFKDEFNLKVNYNRYRMLQMNHVFKGRFLDMNISANDMEEFLSHMRLWEKMVYGLPLWLYYGPMRKYPKLSEFFRKVSRNILGNQYPNFGTVAGKKTYANIMEVFEQENPLGL